MKCPVCNDVRMREVEKDGVLIDVCPDCKGVWLDRGELEKLLGEIRELRPAFDEWYESREGGQVNQRSEHQYRQPSPDPNYNHGYGAPPSQQSYNPGYGNQSPQQGYDSRYHESKYNKKQYKYKKKKSVLDVLGDLFD
ncbi:TFIIB-type zinc ribbon-containing protein [Paenibacillus bouchesdurhonensis]|uniref:TFIIB-type zinc ribbon-containing protein n=1 Tax=Paenibacillus bouchesdurhonensis TaxID=1870990 RepID=UPI000DA60720|nr:zf-TFIIB domain-containing protein [Paenibacillus bouchesdurhonensis]